jgi:hypothetical protein
MGKFCRAPATRAASANVDWAKLPLRAYGTEEVAIIIARVVPAMKGRKRKKEKGKRKKEEGRRKKDRSYAVEGRGNDQWLKTAYHYQLRGALYSVSDAEQRSGQDARAPGLFQLRYS